MPTPPGAGVGGGGGRGGRRAHRGWGGAGGAPGRGLAGVVEEGGQAHDPVLGRRGVDRGERVMEDIVGVVAVLRNSVASGEFRQDAAQEPCLVEEGESGRWEGREEELLEFVADPFGGDLLDPGSAEHERAIGPRLEVEVELRGEADRPQEPQAVLGEAFHRIADGAQDASLEVGEPAGRVGEPAVERIPGEGVDGEITPDQVVLEVVGELNLVRAPRVAVEAVAAKGRDLVGGVLMEDSDRAEARSQFERAREERPGPLGSKIGGEVPVRDPAPEQEITHGAAHDPGLPSGRTQARCQVQDGRRRGQGCAIRPIRRLLVLMILHR